MLCDFLPSHNAKCNQCQCVVAKARPRAARGNNSRVKRNAFWVTTLSVLIDTVTTFGLENRTPLISTVFAMVDVLDALRHPNCRCVHRHNSSSSSSTSSSRRIMNCSMQATVSLSNVSEAVMKSNTFAPLVSGFAAQPAAAHIAAAAACQSYC